jgi:hypothetical protein
MWRRRGVDQFWIFGRFANWRYLYSVTFPLIVAVIHRVSHLIVNFVAARMRSGGAQLTVPSA